MERYPAPPSKPDPGTAEWAFDWVAETAGPLAAWVAGQATAEPAITALLGVVAAVALWRLAWAIIKTPRQPSGPTFISGDSIPTCRWARDRRRHRRTRFTRWVCAECGAEGYSADDSPPTECKRALRAHQL